MIKSIELTVHNETDTVSVQLSPLQAKTVFKILMIAPNDETTLNMADDNTLKKIWSMRGNPLRLTERNDTKNET